MNAHQGASLTRANGHFFVILSDCHLQNQIKEALPNMRQIYARIYALKRECERQDVVYSGA